MIRHFLTAKDTTDCLTEQPPLTPSAARNEKLPSLLLDPAHRFQAIEGIGGTFTEAAAVTFNKLGDWLMGKVISSVFTASEHTPGLILPVSCPR